MTPDSPIIKLPPQFANYEDAATRPLKVCSAHVKCWLRFWWGGVNADSYLESLISTGQLTVMKSTPFRRKRMFDTEEVLRWALANGAGVSQQKRVDTP